MWILFPSIGTDALYYFSHHACRGFEAAEFDGEEGREEEAEQRVNSSPMRGPDYFYPFEKFLALRNLFDDRNQRRLSFTLPNKFRCLAHRTLHESFTFPLYCFSNEAETAVLPVEDLMLLHDGAIEALALKLAAPEDIDQLEELADLLLDAIEEFLA
ncbi:hypothetical protein P4C99_11340 [Pontiellaceae bacterium B1224]|nr:hypothetical protein [Pontiellaceae bacterium B1224]